ncbi:hypothetical protein L2E82_18453 [Cichorium intybus]|uniref:Uncharacterized protein n=1 Tax=Cichorium intybus TaxID=13427 RepID=A0ACB9FAF1_CICIN|nr:hypothetical protein L2E82_18453 [Cichorium intybus]
MAPHFSVPDHSQLIPPQVLDEEYYFVIEISSNSGNGNGGDDRHWRHEHGRFLHLLLRDHRLIFSICCERKRGCKNSGVQHHNGINGPRYTLVLDASVSIHD